MNTSRSTIEAPRAIGIREALAPVEALKGEHSQLEDWVRESFAALESLNTELGDWQRDLTREQARLDQREAAIAEAETADRSSAERLAQVERELVRAQDDCRQWDQENAEQLQTLEQLERQLASDAAELKAARRHAQELTASLEAERRRSMEEHRQLAGEMKEMRRLLERHGDMLEVIGAAVDQHAPAPMGADAEDDDAGMEESNKLAAKAAELRQRATTRRAVRRPSE